MINQEQRKSRVQPPKRRPLRIFATDPMLGKMAHNWMTIDVPNEPLQSGPSSTRIRVIDYDGAAGLYYEPVNLDDPNVLIQGGLEPSESNPHFHQQMVYAVISKVLENFELAMGRRLNFKHGKALRVLPHGFVGANAYYDPRSVALLFGYFTSTRENDGRNLPGQTIFSCLSHDIIAHETTHALLDRIRRYFTEPTNRDVAAFHEGFADIVAIFQHFSFMEILRQAVQDSRSNLRTSESIVALAQQFGYATGKGEALRSAARNKPDPNLYQSVFEPHERGSILVAAVFDAFFATYQARIKKLVRVSTGGTGILPAGDLHPDLVDLIAAEAAAAAHSILLMCIRALDYLPPVDVNFGDFLRALVTADYELSGQDEFLQRASMIGAFRSWGIYPDGVFSLAEESLIWPNYISEGTPLGNFPVKDLGNLIVKEAALWSSSPFDFHLRSVQEHQEQSSRKPIPESAETPAGNGDEDDLLAKDVAKALHDYAAQNRKALGLHPDYPIAVHGFHPVFRTAPHGQMIVELIAIYTQTVKDSEKEDKRLGGLPVRGGTTVVASAEGVVKYVIAKPLPSANLNTSQWKMAEERMIRQREFVSECDRKNVSITWTSDAEYEKRMKSYFNFSVMHRGI